MPVSSSAGPASPDNVIAHAAMIISLRNFIMLSSINLTEAEAPSLNSPYRYRAVLANLSYVPRSSSLLV
jgi:hypothetical protein